MNALLAFFLITALGLVECLLGGKRLALGIPSYALLGIGGLSSVFAFHSRKVGRPRLVCLCSSTLFFGFILIRAGCSPVERLALPDMLSVLAALIVYLLTGFYLRSRLQIVVVISLLAIALAHLGVGAVQFTRNDNFMPFSFLPRFNVGIRASGMYDSPNHLAGFLEPVIMLALGIACWSRWRVWIKVLIGYIALLCVAGVFLTGSRGGLISLCAGLLTLGVLSTLVAHRNFKTGAGWTVVITVVFLALLAGGISVAIRAPNLMRGRTEAALEAKDPRLELSRMAMQQFRLSPLIGTGSGTFLYYARRFRPTNYDVDPISVHNDYLHLLAEYGLVGGAGFLIFLFAHLGNGWRTINQLTAGLKYGDSPFDNALALSVGALAAVATYLVHSAVDLNLHIPANALVMAFVFGVLTKTVSSSEESRANQSSRLFQWALPVLGAWTLLFVWPLVPSEYFSERAMAARLHQDHPAAIAFAEKGLQYDPRNPRLYFYLAQAESDLADPLDGEPPGPEEKLRLLGSAAENYRKGLALFPQDEFLMLGLTSALDGLGRFEEAEKIFPDIFRADPNSFNVAFRYAAHLHAWGKRDEAEAEYRRSLAMLFNWGAKLGLDRLLTEPHPSPAPVPQLR